MSSPLNSSIDVQLEPVQKSSKQPVQKFDEQQNRLRSPVEKPPLHLRLFMTSLCFLPSLFTTSLFTTATAATAATVHSTSLHRYHRCHCPLHLSFPDLSVRDLPDNPDASFFTVTLDPFPVPHHSCSIMSQFVTQTNSDIGESESGSTTVRRRRKTSPVWLHFRKVGTKAFCNHCSMEFVAGTGSGTTHLHRHIGVCQKIDEVERERWLALDKETDFFGAPNYKFDPVLTRNLMTLLFIDAEIPFNVIESRFFEPVMRSLRPEYKPVGRQTLRNDCVQVFKAGVEITMKEFEGLDSRVSFTSDIWTSSVHLGYLCLTVHFIDKDFKFQNKIISFKQIPYSHTGVNVAGLMRNILTEWKLDYKIFTITLDNCAVNDVAVGLLEKHFWEKTIFKGKYMHMRCAAHILNIMVQCGMKIISPSLILIRDIIRNIASSGSKLQLFNDKLKDLNLPSKRGLILDCPTRWNSTYEMIREALKYKEALDRFGDDVKMVVPSLEKWKEVEEMARFLEVFLDATKTFSIVRRPSSNSFMKEVCSVRIALLEEEMGSNTTMQNLSKEMKKKFDKYWEYPNLILTLACIFDPRRKMVCVDFCFQYAYGEKTALYNERMSEVQTSLKKFYDGYEKTTGNTDGATSSRSPQVESGILQKIKFEMRFSQFQVQNNNPQQKKCELDSYLEEPLVVSEDEEFNVLEWWKRKSNLFPILAKMARDFLAVPVSTVASESAFSAAGRLTDNLRSSMTPETIEALVCSKDWFASIDGNFKLDQFRPFMHFLDG